MSTSSKCLNLRLTSDHYPRYHIVTYRSLAPSNMPRAFFTAHNPSPFLSCTFTTVENAPFPRVSIVINLDSKISSSSNWFAPVAG